MKKEWSAEWKSSKQPRKQRKYRYNAPLHVRRKFMSAHLSKELRERLGRRSLEVRRGDKVQVMRGQFRGVVGTVERVSLKRLKVYVDRIRRKKADGKEVMIPIDPSNLMIVEMAEDSRRLKVVE